MFYQTEEKMQGWRALAVFEDGSERLLYVGRSSTQVRENFVAAFEEFVDETERTAVNRIQLQCWQGAADKGHWKAMSALAVPGRKPTAQPAVAAEAEPAVLPFRRPTIAAEGAREAVAN